MKASVQVLSNANFAAATPMGMNAAARLLMQATMGTTLSDLQNASTQSYAAWFAAQAANATSLELPQTSATSTTRQPAWWYNAVYGSDQLRQRMAFALSEIMVVSEIGTLLSHGQALAYYYDLLSKNALGNYRTLLGAVSVSPEMGKYLTFFKSDIPNAAIGVQADENYAREVMQLFTIGLWELNPDGTQKLDGSGNPIPTFTNSDITALANVFTGWGSNPVGGDSGERAWNNDVDLLDPMVCYPTHHDVAAKTIVGGVIIPAGGTCQSDLATALDTLFNHPNIGPFISKQLIQRLVTSNPSSQYVARVAAVFANNGKGVRGDLLAVAMAILTDREAITVGTTATAGKLREPVLRLTALWRTFSATQSNRMVTEVITHAAAVDFGQASLESPTVFNFFTPTYERAGPLAAAGLVAPEFQITNENTIVLTANDLQTAAYKFAGKEGLLQMGYSNLSQHNAPSATDMVLHTADWEVYAVDGATLVTQLELVLMPGQMSPAMYNTLVSYVNSISVADRPNRVIETASLIIDSPQYSVQR